MLAMEYQSAHSLLGCPVEVCYSIFSYLSRADLHDICLVHANLRTLAEPYLYSNIQFTWEEELQPQPITSLLRSLLRRPQLATYVSRVSLSGSYFHNPFFESRAPKILVSESELEELLGFVRKTTVPYRWTWLEELRNGTMNAFVAVLLSQPLRLTCLVIDGDFLWESQFIGLVFRSMICEPNAYNCGLRLDFSYLETVSLQTSYDHFRFYNNARNTADLLPIFYLPSIKRLSASIDNPKTFSWPAIHPPSSSRLHDLKLEYLRDPFLGQVLSATDQLKSLHWKWHFYEEVYDEQFRMRIIDLTQITKSISYVRETLTELVISATNHDDSDPLPLTIQGSMKGMSEFKKLTKLSIPVTFLMGGWSADLTKRIEDCLPQSLEFSTITDDLSANNEYRWRDHDLYNVLERWLKTYQASTPQLCDVKFIFHHPHENAALAPGLSGLTNKVRVRFQRVRSGGRGRLGGFGRGRST
ncbi:hypothetical protein BGW36DRAFT_389283 [Talaromyces proteolyticus]|uniref:F-box domain-containing protein n=1 Tax=Talaromyces proteolyticus TaxID=1131652 RepID=A0AAD4KFI0_9EURO|nr:uncharacterized protein BGW36DRAFT_389283 [Talaromyces proteolyticus]KAH8690765.1 hypothetical protein BGW36DRAFT_389283 [Talaromyces proteolyticus]